MQFVICNYIIFLKSNRVYQLIHLIILYIRILNIEIQLPKNE